MNTMFCIRRLLVGLFTIFSEKPLVINIYINIYSSLYIIRFYFDKKPMLTPTLNKIELLNEIFQLFSNYFMFLFTDFIGDVEFRYQIGYSFIGYVSMVFLINLSIIVADMFTDIRLKSNQKAHDKKWKEFYEKEDEILEFIIRDFRKKCPKNKESHQELKTRYTF